MRYDFAPMEGITGYLYRNAHHRHFSGVDRYYMPFLSLTQNRLFTPRMRQDVEPARNTGLTAIPQLMTKNADDFCWAAQALADMGYEEINLNLGCPSGTVVAKGKGAGFLAFPGELERFLDRIFADAPLKISIKTRLGVTDPAEFGLILELYNQYPMAEVIIHPRVQRDFYQNTPRMDAFAVALADSQNPVCYNGDLLTAADCAALAAQFGQVSAIMVGRGLLANPALFSQVRGGKGVDKPTLRAFHDELYSGYCAAFGSERNAMLRMKEVWFYLIRAFESGEKLSKRLRKASDPHEFSAVCAAIFDELALTQAVSANG